MAGNDLLEGETKIYESKEEYPNVIIIEGGMNDSFDSEEKESTYFSQFEVKKENVLKMLAETKKRLKEDIGYDDGELKKFMEPIFQRIKDSNQISG